MVLDFGLHIILYLQGLGNWLAGPMEAISFLGTGYFFLVASPALYWCWDASLGMRLGLWLMIGSGLNLILKLAWHAPRPYWVDGRIKAFIAESSFGIPSGHAQNAVLGWGGLANWFKRSGIWLLAGVLILLIGLSRLFLGVHFPSDVLVGWIIGGLLLWGMGRLEKPFLAWLDQQYFWARILVCFIASILIVGLGFLARQALGGWSVPESWIQRAAQAIPGSEPIDPLAMEGLIANGGVLFGLAAGGLWLKIRGGFNTCGSWGQRLLRFLVGLAGLAILWFGLGALLPRGETLLLYLLRYTWYALVGLWISALAPMVFLKFGLSSLKVS